MIDEHGWSLRKTIVITQPFHVKPPIKLYFLPTAFFTPRARAFQNSFEVTHTGIYLDVRTRMEPENRRHII